MNLPEAAQRLLQAINAALPYAPHRSEFDVVADAADDLRAALAAPTGKDDLQVEPVAWMDIDSDGNRLSVRQWSDGNREEVPLYLAPPKRKPLTEPLSAAIESILHTDDLSEEIHQAQINSLRAAYDAAKSKHGGRNESA